MIVIPVKDIYQNIKGVGKVKELTKGKQYENLFSSTLTIKSKSISVINDLGQRRTFYKSNKFITLQRHREEQIKSILNES